MKKNRLTKKLDQLREYVQSLDDASQQRHEGVLSDLKGEFHDLIEANEVLEGYNRSLSMKMVERTEELQSLLDKFKEEQAFQLAYNNLVTSLNSSVELSNLLKDALRGMLRFSRSQVGILYLFDLSSQSLRASEWIGVTPKKKEFYLGEGLLGQSAEEKKNMVVSQLPENCALYVESGIFSSPPKSIGYFPILYRDDLLGIFELGSLQAYKDKLLLQIDSALVQVAISIHNAILYRKSKAMAEKFKATSEKLSEKNQALEIQQRLLAEQKQELDYKNRELKNSSEQKSNFLTTMSHELRTPLNSIIGYTDLVLKKAGDTLGKHRKKMEKVLNNGQHLLSLINNILDLSKIEAGKMELFVEEFHLSKLIHTCLSTAQGLVEGKPIRLIEDLQGKLPLLKTDQSKLKQVLINLLGNAAKFTEQGSITVFACCHPSTPSWIRISVIDTGPGIPEEKLVTLFQSFTQVDGSATRRHGGTGLGLAIVKKMTQLMHGHVSMESEVGKGSTFHLDIPCDVYSHIMGGGVSATWEGQESQEGKNQEISLAAAEESFSLSLGFQSEPSESPSEPPSPQDNPAELFSLNDREKEPSRPKSALDSFLLEQSSPPLPDEPPQVAPDPQPSQAPVLPEKDSPDSEAALGQKLLLVVDDDEVVHDLFNHFLEDSPYGLISVTQGEKAVESALKYKPFAIFLDIILKDSNGWELLQKLRELESLSKIPIVISSNIDNTSLAENLGASYFLSKPVSRTELFGLLEKIESANSSPFVLLLSHEESPLVDQIKKEFSSLRVVTMDNLQKALPLFNDGDNFVSVIVDLLFHFEENLKHFDELVMNLPVLEPPVISLVDPSALPQPPLPELSDHIVPLSATSIDLVSLKEKLQEIGGARVGPLFAPESADPEHNSHRKKILVVEDVPDNMEFVCDVLGDDYEMICARDGQEGVSKAAETLPHLILMDLLLPNIDGLEATKLIRENPDTSHIPIIALTAHAMVGDREKALKSGCIDYLTKPIVSDVLKKRVSEVLSEVE